MQDTEDKLFRFEHFHFFVFKEALLCSEEGQGDQTATIGTHFAPDAKSPLGTKQILPIGAPITIIKFVEPVSAPGTVLSSDLCNNHPVWVLEQHSKVDEDVSISLMSKLRLRKLAPHPPTSRKKKEEQVHLVSKPTLF